MDSQLLATPDGITARLGWDPGVNVHDRIRALGRELVADRLDVEQRKVVIEREAPAQFGSHTQLFASVDSKDVPLTIKVASYKSASVVAVADPAVPIGVDIRDHHPDDATIREIRRHSHLFENSPEEQLVRHWTHVHAVLAADGRGLRVHPENVRLDSRFDKGWVPDRPVYYKLKDISRGNFVITLAYGAHPRDQAKRP